MRPFLLFISFLFLIILFSTSLCANIHIVDNNEIHSADYSSFFLAQNAAEAGDTIYLVPSALYYGTISINKPLVILGGNINPQYSNGQLRSWVGIIQCQPGSDGSVVAGLWSESGTCKISSGVSQVTFAHCDLFTLQIDNTANAGHVIKNCIIQNRLGGGSSSNRSEKLEIYNNLINRLSNVDSCQIKNNLFFDTGNSNGTLGLANVLENNVWLDDNGTVLLENICTDCNFSNNLSLNSDLPAENDNLNDSLPLYNNLFSDLNNWYEMDLNYPANSPLVGHGNDGSDVGIFGGNFPMDEVLLSRSVLPQIIEMQTNDGMVPLGSVQKNDSIKIELKISPGKL